MKESLKQGSERVWNLKPDIVDHPVKVVGLSNTEAPVLGYGYIVELLKPLPNHAYTHAIAFEVNLS